MAKSNVVPFRKPPKAGRAHDRQRAGGGLLRSGQNRWRKRSTTILCAAIIAVGGWLAYGDADVLPGFATLAKTPTTDSLSAAFSICNENHRANCVVDGDTFRFNGEKIRIADIDTPELSPPRCEAERIKGEAAKSRLLTLLNAGKFSLTAGFREEDKYGRKVRTVSRAGNSLGDVLIKEGLARPWDGARHGWCQAGDSQPSFSSTGEGQGVGEREQGTVPFPHGRKKGGLCPSFMG
ncbi:thermonuclease family protein [Rhizobium laguerreae]|nr:thermonuclease family protein [Rhizobium laguerreae]MBY2941918.1 thermonuclease family protein [Rhizobium leguminosarum]TBZ68385.1 thermonuclease family protein [Rhizobium leguminosarum bv. viciae]MBY3279724.1 thermonuclease family protein [Rhizobium laguerreae]MBY3299946.1 thermonuclease family protein [Rhizobium laguerreae]